MSYYYLAGPMRGYDEFNFPAFHRIAAALRARGYEIASPAEKDEADGHDWTGTKGTESELDEAGFDISKTLAADIGIIAHPDCAGVITMEGWEQSGGARAEVGFAQAIGKVTYRFFEYTEMFQPSEAHLVAFGHNHLSISYNEVHDKWLP